MDDKKYMNDLKGMYLPHAGVLEAHCELWNCCWPHPGYSSCPHWEPQVFWEPSFPFCLFSHLGGISALTSCTCLFLLPSACLGPDYRLSGVIFINSSNSCFLCCVAWAFDLDVGSWLIQQRQLKQFSPRFQHQPLRVRTGKNISLSCRNAPVLCRWPW